MGCLFGDTLIIDVHRLDLRLRMLFVEEYCTEVTKVSLVDKAIYLWEGEELSSPFR